MTGLRRLMLGLAAFTALPASNAFAGQEGPAVRGRTFNGTDATFQFDASAPGAKGSDITIRCIDGCKPGAPIYHEHVEVSPTYVMVPKDGSTRFISLWTTGSAYLVMVHDVAGTKVTKVLEHGSRIPPSSMGLDDQGNEFFTLCDEDHGCSEYHWKAGRYEATPREGYHWAK